MSFSSLQIAHKHNWKNRCWSYMYNVNFLSSTVYINLSCTWHISSKVIEIIVREQNHVSDGSVVSMTSRIFLMEVPVV